MSADLKSGVPSSPVWFDVTSWPAMSMFWNVTFSPWSIVVTAEPKLFGGRAVIVPSAHAFGRRRAASTSMRLLRGPCARRQS